MIAKSSEALQIEAGRGFNQMLRDMIIEDEKIIKELHMVAGNVVMTWSKEVLYEWR